MDHFEMTEKLRERAQVSYEEAKEALELNEWDMLEAMVYLERMGKADAGSGQAQQQKAEPKQERKPHVSGNLFEMATRALTSLLEKGNRNWLEIYREGKRIGRLPITAAVLLALLMFWVVVPAMVIGLVAGCTYRLAGPDIDKKDDVGEVV